MHHHQACIEIVSWALSKPWCQMAVAEISGRSTARNKPLPPPAGAGRDERKQYEQAVRSWRKSPDAGGGVLDVLAVTGPGRPNPRVAIVEVKVSYRDLVADLRARKMLRYEPQATHVYLAATSDIWDRPGIIPELGERGLPAYWGLLHVQARDVCALRSARAFASSGDASVQTRESLTRQMAASLSYKLNNLERLWHNRGTHG